MLDFKSTETIQSKTCEGVSFTVRKATVGGRAELDQTIAESLDKQDAVLDQLGALVKKPDDGTEPDPKNPAWTDDRKAAVLMSQSARLKAYKLNPEYVRWGLISIDGLTIDGDNHIDAERLIKSGPEQLVHEIAQSVRRLLGMEPDDQKNSQSPTTSQEAAGATPSSTTA